MQEKNLNIADAIETAGVKKNLITVLPIKLN